MSYQASFPETGKYLLFLPKGSTKWILYIYIYIYIFLQNNTTLDIFILLKGFHPRLLMHCVSFWYISECLNLFSQQQQIVVFEFLICSLCEKLDLKIIQSLLERVQICKICWKTEESAGHGGFFWRTVLGLTVQNKQGTHEQPSQNKTTVVDHPGNHTQY